MDSVDNTAMDLVAEYGHWEMLGFCTPIAKKGVQKVRRVQHGLDSLKPVSFCTKIAKKDVQRVLWMEQKNGHMKIIRWLRT